MQLGHPRAAAGDGQVRSDAQLAQGRCHISGVGLGDLRSHIPPPMGCRACPAGFRLRLSRAYLAFSAQPRPADRAYKNTSAELDPSDSGWYAAEAAPILGGHMRGRIGTSARIAPRAFAFVVLLVLRRHLLWFFFSSPFDPSRLALSRPVVCSFFATIYVSSSSSLTNSVSIGSTTQHHEPMPRPSKLDWTQAGAIC